MEQWERNWKDYYKILQLDSSAEKEVIEAAYKKLSLKYHPDRNSKTGDRMKDLNEAYEVLGDPERREKYDQEWHKKSGKHADSRRTYTPSPPKKPVPVVEPTDISFRDVSPGKIQKASFIIRNIGGPYKKIWFSDPKSWVRVTSYTSLTTDDELPLKVEIEATGKDWGGSYSESIRVKLDEEETRIIITLKTRPKPVTTVSPAIAGVGILALFIIVLIIVSNVGRKNDKHSQSNLNQIKSGLSQPPYQDLPFPQRYVEDRVNIISDTVEKGLNGYLVELEQKTGTQMIVLTINTTGSIPIETYAIELATKWKLGQKGKDNGVLIVIAKDDRAYRIEVGYGLEGILPDGFCSMIGKTYFVPNFQKGQFDDGIYQGVFAIGNKITKDSPISTSSPSAPVESPVTVNISGEWEGKVNNKPATLKITQDGNSLKGNIDCNNVKEFLSGEINNDKIVLKGTGYTAKGVADFSLDTFSGTISSQDGDFIRGNYTNEAGNSGTWFVTKSKSSPQVAAQKSIANHDILSKDEVKAVIEKRVNLGNKDGSADEITQLYADKVDFWDKGFVTKDFIRQEIISTHKMWPQRKYRLSSSIMIIPGNTDNEKTAKYTVYCIDRNDQKTIEGDVYVETTLQKQENLILVIREKGETRNQRIKDNLDHKRRKNVYEYEYRSKGPLDLRGNFQFRWK